MWNCVVCRLAPGVISLGMILLGAQEEMSLAIRGLSGGGGAACTEILPPSPHTTLAISWAAREEEGAVGCICSCCKLSVSSCFIQLLLLLIPAAGCRGRGGETVGRGGNKQQPS